MKSRVRAIRLVVLVAGALALARGAAAQTITCSSSSVVTPGTPLTIRGTGFNGIPSGDPSYVAAFSASLSAGGVSAPLTIVSPTEIRVTVPMRAATGPVSLVRYVDLAPSPGAPVRRLPRTLARCVGSVAVLPLAPVLNEATVTGATSVLLRWTDVLNESGYEISDVVGGVEAPLVTAGTNATSKTVTIPQTMATHTFKVRAINASGHSDYSNSRTVSNFAAVHVANDANAQYDVVSVQLNGVEQLSTGSIAPGTSRDIGLQSGTLDIWIGVVASGRTTRLPSQHVNAFLNWNARNTYTFHRVTLGELMTQGTSPRTWSVAGSTLEFRFFANGRWEHLTNGVQDAQGMSLSEVSFPRSALDQVTIDLIPSAHGPFNVLFPWGVDNLGASQTPNFSTATGPSPTPHRYDRH